MHRSPSLPRRARRRRGRRHQLCRALSPRLPLCSAAASSAASSAAAAPAPDTAAAAARAGADARAARVARSRAHALRHDADDSSRRRAKSCTGRAQVGKSVPQVGPRADGRAEPRRAAPSRRISASSAAHQAQLAPVQLALPTHASWRAATARRASTALSNIPLRAASSTLARPRTARACLRPTAQRFLSLIHI